MKIVKCRDVTKQYGKVKALDGINLSMDENKITGVIGRNGAGKTTFMKLLAGMLKETSGRVDVFSQRPFNNLTVSVNTIYIDDQMNFPPTLTLVELLEEGRRFYPNWNHDLALGLFEHFGFRKKDLHKNLSKGKESAFNMIVGIASRCALTIFDEPTTGMDAVVRKDFYRALLKDYIEYPRTILMSTHYMDDMEELFEDVLLIDQGKVKLHIGMDDLRGYAVGLSGKKDDMLPWLEGRNVLYQKETGFDDVYAVVVNDDQQNDWNRMGNIKRSAVRPSDVCVYLTNDKGGELEHVFRSGKNE
ncbi:ABC transporter ATP-binding protein [Halobacillus litoralis]|uniref:ATP-binding cassette domain-containing protein n=1 Tax=Halobacillus litoralis TaxID=45668 RepID=UPI001CD2FFF6|nr:ABC transporter ATP-binding protein [Halobacillus litoralis]MCA0972039.1 ABC transporter ATP-binding protein [Halobacillus litoralis]